MRSQISIKNLFYILSLSLLFLLISCKAKENQNNNHGDISQQRGTNNYEKDWEIADSLIGKGLPKSALEVVNNIYAKAKKDNNPTQIIKANLYDIKLSSDYKEDYLKKIIQRLNFEISESNFPTRQILHSILAQVYWQYYQTNRYKFHNQSEQINYDNDDIATWPLKKLITKVISNYTASLNNPKALQDEELNIYDQILQVEKGSKDFRPTLYDFLAHRAIDFFVNDEPSITRPAEKFEIDKTEYFDAANKFVQIKLTTNDTLSLKFYALKILQDLLNFHLKDNNIQALIDADLKRLYIVKSNTILQEKDSLYLYALKSLEKKYSDDAASADVTYEIAKQYKLLGQGYKPLESPKHKWDVKEAYSYCLKAINNFPESRGANNCKVLIEQINQKKINVTTNNADLPDKPVLALVSYKNISELHFRLIKTTPEHDRSLRQDFRQMNLIEKYLELEALNEWSQPLVNDGDYQEHSVEVKIPELPLGYYVLLASPDKGFSPKSEYLAYTSFYCTRISYFSQRNYDATYNYYVLDRESGQPMSDVTAQTYYREYDYNARKYNLVKWNEYKTDENGFFQIASAPESRMAKSIYIDFTYKEDQYISPNYFHMSTYRPGQIPKITRTFFYTDRAIYRPGQTIYFKGIVLEKDGESYEILPENNTTVTFYDVNGEKISSLELVSNEYGSFSGSFVAPQGTLNGTMRIADHNGSVSFQVEEYKRPKFEVGFEQLKGSYKLEENVNVNGFAKAYAGYGIDNATVNFRVVRKTYFPYFGWWWRGYYPESPKVEIVNGTTNTDDNGNFNFTFKAIPDKGLSKIFQPVFNYQLIADVTDINGETHSSTKNIIVGYTALLLDADIPEMLDKGSKSKFDVSTTNLNGSHENTELNIKIYKLREPGKIFRERIWPRPDLHIMTKEDFYSSFPYDQYDNELSVFTWEKEKSVFDEILNTANDNVLDIASIKQWPSGHYVAELSATDNYGEAVQTLKYFTLFDKQSNKIPDNSVSWFALLKGEGEPGEKASFIIGSRAKDVSVLYETERKGKIINKEWIKLNNQQKILEIPIKEQDRGNFSISLYFAKYNRSYTIQKNIVVPYSNKELDITFETFRNKLLPGEKEEWKLRIKDHRGDKVAAEMLASMYDASLDAFVPHEWSFDIYRSYYYALTWDTRSAFTAQSSSLFTPKSTSEHNLIYKKYDQLNWFGFRPFSSGYLRGYGETGEVPMQMDGINAKAALMDDATDQGTTSYNENKTEPGQLEKLPEPEEDDEIVNEEVQVRRNFMETGFFYPHLETNENGEVLISFTVPESLTKWKMMGLAHTKDLKYKIIQKELITQKDLMVIPNAPRFFREGDTLFFSAKISNLSDKELTGEAILELFDATTMKAVDDLFRNNSRIKTFATKKGKSDVVSWMIIIPDEGLGAITYRIKAKSGNFSDGEEMTLPVLTNRMLVTESLPLPVNGEETKSFTFDKLLNSGTSSTIKNFKLTLEYSSNPAWYAIQALPYLMEYPYECSEQIFSRYYANSIASHIVNSSPKIKSVFESWQNYSPDALLSNLEKNQELKSVILEETPWVLDARNETERKQRIAMLFDLNKMSNELNRAVNQLYKMQSPNGGWPWFKGMPDSRYITQHIVTGLGHLDNLGVIDISKDEKFKSMVKNAVNYLDQRIVEDYNRILESHPEDLESNHLSQIQIQYLYARSYFIKDIPVLSNIKTAFNYYQDQSRKYWLENNKYLQAMIALALHRYGDKNVPEDILKSIMEHSLCSEEMGMYWRDEQVGYFWYQAPIERQALFIEAFDEINGDSDSVEKMKIWLLKQKQTQDWKTTKATVEAVYALLLRGTDWLASDELVDISLGNLKIDPKKIDGVSVEAGTGYFKTSWTGGEIKPGMGNVTVTKKDEGVAWGALYWQYFEQLDKITTHETPLQLDKKLFLEKNTASGPALEPVNENSVLKIGDKIKVRIILRVDRDMEYVHMKDMRASAFEPVNVISSYKYQGGIGYYESTKDAATNFFISYLRKGTYMFEYPLVVSQKGDFSNGITTIQCMYAPEFGAHSEGIRVKVGE